MSTHDIGSVGYGRHAPSTVGGEKDESAAAASSLAVATVPTPPGLKRAVRNPKAPQSKSDAGRAVRPGTGGKIVAGAGEGPADGGKAENKALAAIGRLSASIANRETKDEDFRENLRTLAKMDLPSGLAERRDAALAGSMTHLVNSALVAEMTGVDVYSGAGNEKAIQLTGAHSAFIRALDGIDAAIGADGIEAALANATDSLADLLRFVSNTADRERVNAILDAFAGAVKERVAALRNDAVLAARVAGAMEKFASAVDKTAALREVAGDFARMAEMRGGPETAAELEKFRAAVGEAYQNLKGGYLRAADRDQAAAAMTGLRRFAETLGEEGKKIDAACGGGPLTQHAVGLETENAVLAAMTRETEELIPRLDSTTQQIRERKLDKFGEAIALLDSVEAGEIPAWLNDELSRARKELNSAILTERNRYWDEQGPVLDAALRGSLTEACQTLDRVLDSPFVSGNMRTQALDMLNRELEARNKASMALLNDIKREQQGLLAMAASSVGHMQRRELAGKLDNLSRRVDAEIAKYALASPESITHFDADMEKTIAALNGVAESLRRIKLENLETVQTFISLLRFVNNIENKLSVEVVLNKGLPGIEAILRHCGLDGEELRDLREKVETGRNLTTGDMEKIARELSNILTGGQKRDPELKKILAVFTEGGDDASRQALLVDLANPDSLHSTALRRACMFLITKDDAGDLLQKLAKTSEQNVETLRAAVGGLNLVGLSGPTLEQGVAGYGARRQALVEQAGKLLTGQDLAAFVESEIRKSDDAFLAALASVCVDKQAKPLFGKDELAGLSDGNFVKLLEWTGYDGKIARMILESGNPGKIITDVFTPETMREAVDKLMLRHPGMDETCLRLKLGLAEELGLDGLAISRRHISDVLVRECRTQLEAYVVLSSKSKTVRDHLLKFDDDEFLKACLLNSGMCEDFDLFVVNALWLRHCSQTPGLVSSEALKNEFTAFQATLPGRYRGREDLYASLHSEAASTGIIDKAGKFFTGEASRFKQEGFVHGALTFFGGLLNKPLTDSETMSRLLESIDDAVRYDAVTVRHHILDSILDMTGAHSMAFDESLIQKIFQRDMKASGLDGIMNSLHLKKLVTKFGGLLQQLAEAAKIDISSDARVTFQQLADLHEEHEPALDAIFAAQDREKAKGGVMENEERIAQFKTGSTVAVFVMTLDTILSPETKDMGEGERRLDNIAGWLVALKLPESYNILSMSVVDLEKAENADSVNSADKDVNKVFRDALNHAIDAAKTYSGLKNTITNVEKRIRNAKRDKKGQLKDQKAFDELTTKLGRLRNDLADAGVKLSQCAETLRHLILADNLPARARARLVYKVPNLLIGESAATKLGHLVQDSSLKHTPVYKALTTNVGKLLGKAARVQAPKVTTSGTTQDYEYYMSSKLVDAFNKSISAALLNAFEQTSDESFATFIAGLAGVMSDAGKTGSIPKSGALTDAEKLKDAERLAYAGILEKLESLVANGILLALPESDRSKLPKEDVEKLVRHFLSGVIERFQRAEGGADAELARRSAAVKDPHHYRKFERAEDAIAVRSGLDRLTLEGHVTGLGKNQAMSFGLSKGVSVSREMDVPGGFVTAKVGVTVDMKHDLVLERDAEGKLGLYIGRGGGVGVNLGLSSLADTLSAEVGVEGSVMSGFRLEFDNDDTCVEFMTAILKGEYSPLYLGEGVRISTVREIAGGVSAKVQFEIGDIVDKAKIVSSIAVHGISDTITHGVDNRRLVDLSLAAGASASMRRAVERKGTDTKETLGFSASAEASAEVKSRLGTFVRKEGEPEPPEWGVEVSKSATFSAKLERTFRSGTLVGAVMTRTFTFDKDATEQEITELLAEYGIANARAVELIHTMARAGRKVEVHLDSSLTPDGAAKIQAAGEHSLKGLIACCNRENFANSLIRVEVGGGAVSLGGTVAKREAPEDESDEGAEDEEQSSPSIADRIQDTFSGVTDPIRERIVEPLTETFVTPVTDRVDQLRAKMDTMLERVPESMRNAADFVAQCDFSINVSASGSMTREFHFHATPMRP